MFKTFKKVFFGLIILIASCTKPLEIDPNFQLYPELAQTPPMGWNSWNWFACDIDEEKIRGIADAISSNGMKEAGYSYVVIDDCWAIGRDENGMLITDLERFPSGIKNLSDYIHSLGLKFGIYSGSGGRTCQGRPGSKDYEDEDAKLFAEWGVDYLKYDWCGEFSKFQEDGIIRMAEALQRADNPVVLSLSEWGQNQPWKKYSNYAHLWRTSYDIGKCFDGDNGLNWPDIIDQQDNLASYAGPGNWNDPDMLQVGNLCMTYEENRAHFSLYALVAAPLMAGNDLRNATPEDIEILTNREVIAVNQDPLGNQGIKFRDNGDDEIWVKNLSNNEKAVVFFNKGPNETKISVEISELGFSNQVNIRDLWKHEELGEFNSNSELEFSVKSHDIVMIQISPQ